MMSVSLFASIVLWVSCCWATSRLSVTRHFNRFHMDKDYYQNNSIDYPVAVIFIVSWLWNVFIASSEGQYQEALNHPLHSMIMLIVTGIMFLVLILIFERVRMKLGRYPKIFNDVDRRDVNKWIYPIWDKKDMTFYNPKMWIYIIIDIAVVSRWYFWHKKQSKKASRKHMATRIGNSLHMCNIMLYHDELSPRDKKYVEDMRKSLIGLTEELNLQSEFLDRRIQEGEDDEE